jgi:DNA polymerase III epsilon subunit-like protein
MLMMALTRLGWPTYRSTNIFAFACRLYPNWSSHSLENVAAQLKSAHVAEDRALPDARLVKDVFFDLLRRIPTVKKISDQAYLSPPLAFADAPLFAIEPPVGFEALTTAITERCAITIRYDRDLHRVKSSKITPRLVLGHMVL